MKRLSFRPRLLLVPGLILGLLGSLGPVLWLLLFRVHPDPLVAAGAPAVERFKYGSIGGEQETGIPYWIWLVLPRVFPQHLPGPGGYLAVGLVWEEGHETPVGIAKRDLGIVPRASINCAICHTATYRTSAGQLAPTIVPGGASTRFDALAYQTFLLTAAADPRFTADNLMPEIRKVHRMSALEDLLYKQVLIPLTRRALRQAAEQWSWASRNPRWGPGRIDPFNPIKYGILKQPRDLSVGNADMMPILGLRHRAGQALHWDGLNPSLREVVLSSAIGDGARPRSLPIAHLVQLEDYLGKADAPRFPFAVDEALADRGRVLYQAQCGQCHAAGGRRTGQVIPVAEVGTDRHRVDMWGQKDADAYNALYARQSWGFKQFQDRDGYVAVPLDGLWLRAPYLHNGSVPNLAALLEPPERRPTSFYRGNDLYEPQAVGFVSTVSAEDGHRFFRHDTAVPGNGNAGHRYGTDLPAEDRRALLEHLKRL
jgi:hypothetical protein